MSRIPLCGARRATCPNRSKNQNVGFDRRDPVLCRKIDLQRDLCFRQVCEQGMDEKYNPEHLEGLFDQYDGADARKLMVYNIRPNHLGTDCTAQINCPRRYESQGVPAWQATQEGNVGST